MTNKDIHESSGAILVKLDRKNWSRELGKGLDSSDRPIVLSLSGRVDSAEAVGGVVQRLLRYPLPVTGVLWTKAPAWTASLFLACDLIYWSRGASLCLTPSGRGEVNLLSLRLGRAAAARTWFSGGTLAHAEAIASGWARSSPAGLDDAIREACSTYNAIPTPVLSSLKELLYHGAGMAPSHCEVLERAAFALAFASRDSSEGIAAFLGKRGSRLKSLNGKDNKKGNMNGF